MEFSSWLGRGRKFCLRISLGFWCFVESIKLITCRSSFLLTRFLSLENVFGTCQKILAMEKFLKWCFLCFLYRWKTIFCHSMSQLTDRVSPLVSFCPLNSLLTFFSLKVISIFPPRTICRLFIINIYRNITSSKKKKYL
jgi:hypothetical protein